MEFRFIVLFSETKSYVNNRTIYQVCMYLEFESAKKSEYLKGKEISNNIMLHNNLKRTTIQVREHEAAVTLP